MVHSAFSGLKPTHRFAKCATLVVSFHFHHIVRQVFQKKFVFLPQIEYTYFRPSREGLHSGFRPRASERKGRTKTHYDSMNILELSEQEIARRNSLSELRALGIDPYPAAEYPTNAFSDEIIANF